LAGALGGRVKIEIVDVKPLKKWARRQRARAKA
jgi:hypothetical protein